jgi:tyrosyl-tRNA synthetase
MDIKKQLEIIKRGTVEIIEEKELIQKIEAAHKNKKPLIIKAGFDPTAPDIHLGHTVLLRKMRHFQDMGHKVVFLIGDYTGMIGDPSGTSKTRPRLTKEEVIENAKTYKKQVSKVLDASKLEVSFNSEWLSKMNAAQVAELMSKYSVQRMIERDDFLKRYTEHKPINMLEFLYPLLQGYDSVVLKADIELGGNDQKFNLLVGRDIQTSYGQAPQVIITMPILEGTDGVAKMSKSYGNYIGINESPKEMFGKVMSISDQLMWRYYELLTDFSMDEIGKMQADASNNMLNPRDAKARLAYEIVTMYHGRDQAKEAEREFVRVFKDKILPTDIPLYTVDEGRTSLLYNLLTDAKLTKSNSEARRLIKQSAVSVDNRKIHDENARIDLRQGMIIQVGKRRIIKIKIRMS